jgi:hypothetical protein
MPSLAEPPVFERVACREANLVLTLMLSPAKPSRVRENRQHEKRIWLKP